MSAIIPGNCQLPSKLKRYTRPQEVHVYIELEKIGEAHAQSRKGQDPQKNSAQATISPVFFRYRTFLPSSRTLQHGQAGCSRLSIIPVKPTCVGPHTSQADLCWASHQSSQEALPRQKVGGQAIRSQQLPTTLLIVPDVRVRHVTPTHTLPPTVLQLKTPLVTM